MQKWGKRASTNVLLHILLPVDREYYDIFKQVYFLYSAVLTVLRQLYLNLLFDNFFLSSHKSTCITQGINYRLHRCSLARQQHRVPAMPRSDNLYSADDSDHESFSEELSPSDGFNSHSRPNVPINVVSDPSLRKEDKPEDKTLIPPPAVQNRTGGSSRTSLNSILPRSHPSHNYASLRGSDNASRSPSSYTPTSPVSSRRRNEMFTERSTLLHGPPPAYSPAEETPRSPQGTEARRYSTFIENQLERGYLPGREPESMGAPEQPSDETTPLSRGSKPLRASIFRKITKKFLLVALFVVVLISLTTAMFSKSSVSTKPVSPWYISHCLVYATYIQYYIAYI